jgi:nucleoside triphosphate pyrophosphatase
MNRRLILASASQGRRELLEEAGYAFEVRVAPEGAEESALEAARAEGALPEALAAAAARGKAEAVAARAADGEVILAADTLVRAVDGTVLGKGANPEESKAILRKLSGTTHHVISGVTIIAVGSDQRHDWVHSSAVHLAKMSAEEIDAYVGSGRSVGASGGYRIQRRGTDPYLSVESGSISNVVGLPMEEIIPVLARLGVEPRAD